LVASNEEIHRSARDSFIQTRLPCAARRTRSSRCSMLAERGSRRCCAKDGRQRALDARASGTRTTFRRAAEMDQRARGGRNRLPGGNTRPARGRFWPARRAQAARNRRGGGERRWRRAGPWPPT
jgi:hypothetical protein